MVKEPDIIMPYLAERGENSGLPGHQVFRLTQSMSAILVTSFGSICLIAQEIQS